MQDARVPNTTENIVTAVTISPSGNSSEFSACRFIVNPKDTDGDGIPDDQETSGPNNGDANKDGKDDKTQPNVSWGIGRSPLNASYILSTPESTSLKKVDSPFSLGASASPGPNVKIPFGYVQFEVSPPLAAPQVNQIKLEYPNVSPALNKFLTYGPTTANPEPHWDDFDDDGTTGTLFQDNTLWLRVIDGGRGDSDRTANGKIVISGAAVRMEKITPRITGFTPVQLDQVVLRGEAAAGSTITLRSSSDLKTWVDMWSEKSETGYFQVGAPIKPEGGQYFNLLIGPPRF